MLFAVGRVYGETFMKCFTRFSYAPGKRSGREAVSQTFFRLSPGQSVIVLVYFRSEVCEVGLRAFPPRWVDPDLPMLVAADYWRLRSGPWPSGKLLVFST